MVIVFSFSALFGLLTLYFCSFVSLSVNAIMCSEIICALIKKEKDENADRMTALMSSNVLF